MVCSHWKRNPLTDNSLQQLRNLSYTILPIILLIFTLTAAAAQNKANETPQYPDPTRFEDAIKAFEAEDVKNMPPAGAIVGAGSSSMRMWHGTIREDLAPLTIITRGFGGSNMNDLLYYADRIVIKYKPRAVMIYEGDNDTAAGMPPVVIRDTFRKFVAKVHDKLPGTRIYVLAIKPSVSRKAIWPVVQEANELLRAECEKNNLLTYLDIATPMLDKNGEVRTDIFIDDNLHMNRTGYEIWTQTIRPILTKTELEFE